MKKLNESRRSLCVVSAGIFLVLLACNLLTDMLVDDFLYCYSFYDGSRIESIMDIFPSLAGHYHTMNGRLVAHFFVQLFLLLPSVIFKFLNAGMFLLQIYLIYRIANVFCRRNVLLFSLIFGAVWLFEPAFGQVNLWLSGAFNYLWCGVFNLLFLIPFIKKFLVNKDIESKIGQVLFVLSGALVGGYSENAALATLIMACVFILLSAFQKHYKIRIYQLAALITFCIGFYFLMSAPATAKNKLPGEMSVLTLLFNFYICLYMLYDNFKVLIIALAVLFTLGLVHKVKQDKIIVAAVMVLGAMASNFAFIFASYYSGRSAFFCVILLIAASAILFSELWDTKYFDLCLCAGVVMLIFTLYFGLVGCKDICVTHITIAKNKAHIAQCKEEGISEIELIMPNPLSKYSAVWELRYLDPDVPKDGPYGTMEQYYGVEKLTGKYVKDIFAP